jgi:hypothetical protein
MQDSKITKEFIDIQFPGGDKSYSRWFQPPDSSPHSPSPEGTTLFTLTAKDIVGHIPHHDVEESEQTRLWMKCINVVLSGLIVWAMSPVVKTTGYIT